MIPTDELKPIVEAIRAQLVRNGFSKRSAGKDIPTDNLAVIRMGPELHDAMIELRGSSILDQGDAYASARESEAIQFSGHLIARSPTLQPRAFCLVPYAEFMERYSRKEAAP